MYLYQNKSQYTPLIVENQGVFENNLLNKFPYIAPNILSTIRNIIATLNPKSGTAEDNAPNALNTVCHLYVAENPTIIPPIIPINTTYCAGKIKYSIQYIIHPIVTYGILSLQRISTCALLG